MYLDTRAGTFVQPAGRWPANLALDEEAAAALDEQSGDRKSGRETQPRGKGGIWSPSQGTPCGHGDSGGGTGVLYGANLLYLWRIMSPQDVTIDGLLMQVQVDGGSGALARCGIYAQDATTAPVGAPLVQSADLNVNVVAATMVSAALTPTALTAWTPYWGALVVNNGTTQFRYMASGENNTTRVSSLDAGQSSSTFHVLRRVAHTFGALPTNPAASFTNAVGDIPGVLWKVQV
jgi:hypothetical protein